MSGNPDFESPLLAEKHYGRPAVFQVDSMLRETRRQRSLPEGPVPKMCLLDPDGDIDPEMIACTRQRAMFAGIPNIVAELRDVSAEGFGVPDASQEACLLFNILHCEEPRHLLNEAARVLKHGGKLFVIHWRPDPATPRGPALEIRPTPRQVVDWVSTTRSFENPETPLDLPPWHYGLRFIRRAC